MKKFLFLAFIAFYLISCVDDTNNGNKESVDGKKYSFAEKPYGNTEGKDITEYTITNPSGMEVSFINYGGTVTKIITPDKNKKNGNVILGYDSLSGYLQKNNPYFNALIGRYGNRIAAGKFTLDSQTYTLAGNDHGNSLHGGNKGYDKVVWTGKKLTDSSLQFSYVSKDGEEGYPGTLTIDVVYTVTTDNSLKIDYTAKTDKATPVNLTSHCYFNLSAGVDSTIFNHDLQMAADKYTPVNASLIPTGKIESVKGGPMDFTTAKPIGKDINSVAGGYDHNWVLNKTGNNLENVASLHDTASGRYMEIWTTEPGLQFYSGNFLDGTLKNTLGGKRYVKHAGLCLETQHFPDSPNQPSFPNTILKPGGTYRQTTVYKFSTK
jgi:aldose 1-epimerase